MFGTNSRAQKSPGSLHCDVWQGTGADLAARRHIAVYPVSGWWKNRVPQKRYDSKTRYALILTLRCLEEDVDLYAEIEADKQEAFFIYTQDCLHFVSDTTRRALEGKRGPMPHPSWPRRVTQPSKHIPTDSHHPPWLPPKNETQPKPPPQKSARLARRELKTQRKKLIRQRCADDAAS